MWKFLAILLSFPGAVLASEMTPVEKAAGFCATNQETYCYEWALARIDGLRFVAHGDEDTIEYSLYDADSGSYDKVVDVFPVLEDPTRPGHLFWGYPWDIADIRLGNVDGKPALLGTRKHGIKVSDEYGSPISDEVRTAILFVGRTTQPEALVEPLNFDPVLPLDLGHDG